MGTWSDQIARDVDRTVLNTREGAEDIRYAAQNLRARVRVPTEVERVTGVVAWDAEITVARASVPMHVEGSPVQIDGVWYRTTRVLNEGHATRTIGLVRSA